MQVVKAMNVPKIPNPHGISVRALHASEHIQMEHLLLQPGEALKKHVASVDVYPLCARRTEPCGGRR